jgi:hypothetical protein
MRLEPMDRLQTGPESIAPLDIVRIPLRAGQAHLSAPDQYSRPEPVASGRVESIVVGGAERGRDADAR